MSEQLREEPLIQVRKPRNRAEALHLLRIAGFFAKDINRILDEAFPDASPAAATAPAGEVTDQQIKDLSEKDEFWRLLPGYEPERRYELDAVAFGRAVLALTPAARAAEPAIHLGAEGQKVFAETLLNPPPPTAAFLKAEESYSNLVRPEATAPAGGMTDGAERWMAIVREKADDARKNAHGLRQFEGMEAEARARELAAQYLLETAHVMVLDERHAEALAGIVDQSGRIAELRAALTTAARAAEPEGLPVAQEPKYTVNGTHIVNRASGEAIPHDEPVFIFRARDKLAVRALLDYAARCTGEHYAAVRKRVKHFRAFTSRHPERMKTPDTAASPTPPTGTSQGEGTS